MRFSTILSSALLVGFVAAAPTNKEMDSAMMDASSSASSAMATESYKSSGDYGKSSSSGGCSGDDCNKSSSSGGNYGKSSSSGGYDSGDYGKSSSSGGDYGKSSSSGGCDGGSCDSYSSSKDNSYSSSSKDNSYSSTMDNSYSSSSKDNSYSSTMDNSYSSSMDNSYSSTMSEDATSTATAYGSGYTNWGGSGYNDCVQQCVASYGAPAGTYMPSSTQGSDDGGYSGSKGTGATHTVIVAPTQGVLRYVPFAVNASVGDTVMFMWNAKNHTVTKSSSLEICNKTTDAPFASGEHDAPFTFTQVVNDTNPTFFYCGTPGHCQKGMFGMINPPSSYMASSSVSQMMGGAVSNSSDMAAMMAYTNTLTANNTKAAGWGSNIDMASLPEWAHSSVLENVMYTRAFLGANPETIKDDGSVDLGGDAPKMIPTDMAPINNAVDSGAATSSQGAQATSSSSAAGSAPSAAGAAASGNTNGAASKAASSALLGVAALAAAVLAF